MALEVVQLENELMKSNCFIIVDRDSKACVIIDPASEKSEREIAYIEENRLCLDYIMLTHEHTDHTWGANALKERFSDAKLLCSEQCEKYAKKASRAYFLLYYDDPNYRYVLKPADVVIYDQEDWLEWHGRQFHFVITPGHSFGSMCIGIDNLLFTGDTIMPFPAYFNGRDSNEDDWKESISYISTLFPPSTTILPGHGEKLMLGNWKHNFDALKYTR